MLQPIHRQRYEEFKQALDRLEKVFAAENLDGLSLKERFQEVKQAFGEIASLTDDDQNPPEVPRWQSFQTEVHRLLRLLEMDVMFLQATRSRTTAKPRLAAMGDRIKTLNSYCEVILQNE